MTHLKRGNGHLLKTSGGRLAISCPNCASISARLPVTITVAPIPTFGGGHVYLDGAETWVNTGCGFPYGNFYPPASGCSLPDGKLDWGVWAEQIVFPATVWTLSGFDTVLPNYAQWTREQLLGVPYKRRCLGIDSDMGLYNVRATLIVTCGIFFSDGQRYMKVEYQAGNLDFIGFVLMSSWLRGTPAVLEYQSPHTYHCAAYPAALTVTAVFGGG